MHSPPIRPSVAGLAPAGSAKAETCSALGKKNTLTDDPFDHLFYTHGHLQHLLVTCAW